MKKSLVILAALLLLVSSGCTQQPPLSQTSVQPATTISESTAAEADSGGLKTTEESLEVASKNIAIAYPKIVGYPGELSMDYMNQSIKSVVDSFTVDDAYANLQLDYTVKRMDESIVSIVFEGTGDFQCLTGIHVQKSINLDVTSTNPINYGNFVKDVEAVSRLLDAKAKSDGITDGFEAEGVSLYFEGDSVVFFYMPLDDAAKDWSELRIPLTDLEGLVNWDFGDRPAS